MTGACAAPRTVRAMRRLLLLALACCALAPAPAAATSFRNPVVPETAGDDSPDPWIFRHGGRYYLTYTSTDHIELRSAATLAGLADARPRRLWPAAGAPEPPERCCRLWAPEIHRFGGRWYLYYAAAGPAGAGGRGARAVRAGEPWRGPGRAVPHEGQAWRCRSRTRSTARSRASAAARACCTRAAPASRPPRCGSRRCRTRGRSPARRWRSRGRRCRGRRSRSRSRRGRRCCCAATRSTSSTRPAGAGRAPTRSVC